MAASVYATPPPDHLSGDETALSDVSNSSQLSSPSNSMKTLKRSLSATSLLSTTSANDAAAVQTTTTSNLNNINNNNSNSNSNNSASNAIPFAGNINITLPTSIANTLNTLTTNAAVNDIGVNNLSSFLLDSMPDNSKKRRKQSTPIRISALAAAAAAAAANNVAALQNMTTSSTFASEAFNLLSQQQLQLQQMHSDQMKLNDDEECDDDDDDEEQETTTDHSKNHLDVNEDADKIMPRIYLSNLSQLQEKSSPPLKSIDFLKVNNDLIAKNEIAAAVDSTENVFGDQHHTSQKDQQQKENGQNDNVKKLSENHEQLLKTFANNLNCDQCGLKLDSEIKLGLHILQEHHPAAQKNLMGNSSDPRSPEDEIPKIYVKKELTNATNAAASSNEWNSGDADKDKLLQLAASKGQMKPEDWLSSLSGLPFPFTPEAAVMLSASGYLPQLPFGVAGNLPFSGADGIPRSSAPQLRIFNPEAYCDLCNKEFCNKYFLKTHKANKHNIYESNTSSTDAPSTSQLNHLTQVFQMQQQQMAAHQQLQQQQNQQLSPKSPPKSDLRQEMSMFTNSNSSQRQSPNQTQTGSSSQEMTIFCDVCFKRFPNLVAMRRHRSKAHEIPPTNESTEDGKNSASASNTTTPLTVPDGFREDYSIEQEDATFTPQPRKLSPQSMQQAREANFSVDKLKRLGVLNPEAFCEICCKEYCNKYFLRTHKIKRHGILIPVDDAMLKDERTMAAAALNWQLMQNSPLNLMISNAEQLNQLQYQRKKLEAGEIRKLSIESIDDELEQPNKKRKLGENDKKSVDENDDNDDGENKSIDNQQDAENISVDLQKIQSMIMQLNDLSAQRPVSCGICGKEQENQFVLHTHMLTEHANLGDNNNGHKISPSSSPNINQTVEVCKHCDKELPNAFALTQHLYEVHGIAPTSPIREGFVTPERPISGMSLSSQAANAQMGERRSYTITPTSSYCEICNKELCNKYFMKTHMQRMHGIEIENGAQIGGVVCNICNKELCSKYFLRVHKHNTHGIVEDGSPLPQPRSNGDQIDPETMFGLDPSIKSTTDMNDRYFSHFNEVCPLCNRRFRGSKWLRTHLLTDHGKAGTDKLREIEQQMVNMPKASTSPSLKIPNGGFVGIGPNDANFMQKQALNSLFAVDEAAMTSTGPKTKEYQCSFCSFSTPSYAFLYIHKRSMHGSLLTDAVGGLNLNAMNDDNASPNNHSETAVSIAKDQPKIESISATHTPSSTPASTPTPIPLASQESASVAQLATNTSNTPTIETEISPLKATLHEPKFKDEQQQQHQQQLQDQQEAHNILAEMANLTKRPTTYAIPQELGNGMFMQSFLLEPIDTNDDTNANGNNDATDGQSKQRFVPSVVFLPVRERVTGKTTVSFSLTPA